MNLEKIYPGIYLTSVKNLGSAESLKLYGFTHIICIDKHIIVDNSAATCIDGHHQNGDSVAHFSQRETTAHPINDSSQRIHNVRISQSASRILTTPNQRRDNKTASTAHTKTASAATMVETAVTSCRPSIATQLSASSSVPLASCARNVHKNENIFGHSDFETLDLNFGESSYLTTVLPNCYKAVKFIETALKNNGAVLVIDCIGENQKCITIVVGFLMYKYNKNFLTAYQLIKRFHPNIELDKFFITQLYEYEPILQVQRTQSGGNSCSRELRSALLKRKKTYDDIYFHADTLMPTILPNAYACNGDTFINNIEQSDILME